MTPILSGGGVWAWANRHKAHGGEAGHGHGRAGKSDRFPELHTLRPPRCGSPRKARNLAAARARRQSGARTEPALDSSAKLRLIRLTAGGRMAEEEVILEAEGLTKEFAGFVAVKNVDLRVRRHTIHALIGPNGAGKTTCFNLLTHFLTPTRGHDPLQRPQYHRQLASGHCAHGARPLVPDLGGLPPSFGARECPCRPAAQARQFLPVLALRAGAGRARRPRPGAGRAPSA